MTGGKGIWTEQEIQRRQSKGRGFGEGRSFKPWLTVGEVPSCGRSHRVYWDKTGRVHHFLSDGEYRAFLLQSWSDDVIDVREQFPLDRSKTIEIARKLAVRHPIENRTSTLLVMSTDLLVTRIENGLRSFCAIAVKTTDDVKCKRSAQKLKIEQLYWEEQGVPWQLLISESLRGNFFRNLDWIYKAPFKPLDHLQADFKAIRQTFCSGAYIIALDACAFLDTSHARESGYFLGALRWLLKLKLITADLNGGIIPERKCSEFAFCEGLEA